MKSVLSAVLLMLALFAGLVFVAGMMAGRLSAHDLYSDWKMPGTSVSCCNEHDCHPTTAQADDDGGWTVIHEGREMSVPANRLLKLPSPDGRSHVCAAPGATVPYCAVIAPPRS